MPEYISEADSAASRLAALVSQGKLLTRDAPDITEADTRCKLIDPIFRDVLGWSENEIRREESAADGYADYVFGADIAHFHVEAKRLRPRFELQAPSRARILKLDGPHLLQKKGVKEHVEQAAKYA